MDMVRPILRNNPFKETVVWTNIAEPPVAANVDGLFQAPYSQSAVLGIEFQSSEPAFHCAEEDVPNIGEGHTITRASVVYKVKEVQPVGNGWTTLILSKD